MKIQSKNKTITESIDISIKLESKEEIQAFLNIVEFAKNEVFIHKHHGNMENELLILDDLYKHFRE